MKFGPDDRFWLVSDPHTGRAIEEDIVLESSLNQLELMFKGGWMSLVQNPTLFTDRGEAEIEARRRLLARRALEAVEAGTAGIPLETMKRIQVLDAAGTVLFERDLGSRRDNG